MRAAPSPRFRRQPLHVEVNAKPSPGYGVAWLATLLFLLVMVAGIWYVGLRSSSDNLGRELQAKRKLLDVGKKELENLNVELERYTSAGYIKNRITVLDTGLRDPMPGQVRRLTVEGGRNHGEFSDISLAAFDSPAWREPRPGLGGAAPAQAAPVGYP